MQADRCRACKRELAPGALACPACHALVHADELAALAKQAEAEEGAGRADRARDLWQRVLALLPPDSKQHAQITARLSTPSPRPRGALPEVVTATGAIVLALWKLKAIVPSLATMVLMFGAYLTAYSWQFALGFVLSLWIHEMGHVFELRRRGIAFSYPMFIPGIGAYVRLKQHVSDPMVDARIGLAGPIAGTTAAAVCMAVYYAGGSEVWFGLAQAGAILNLFNLTPLFSLDGGRAFNAMSRLERSIVMLALGVAVYFSNNGILWLPLVAASIRLFGASPQRGDRWTVVTFVALVGVLSVMAAQP